MYRCCRGWYNHIYYYDYYYIFLLGLNLSLYFMLLLAWYHQKLFISVAQIILYVFLCMFYIHIFFYIIKSMFNARFPLLFSQNNKPYFSGIFLPFKYTLPIDFLALFIEIWVLFYFHFTITKNVHLNCK